MTPGRALVVALFTFLCFEPTISALSDTKDKIEINQLFSILGENPDTVASKSPQVVQKFTPLILSLLIGLGMTPSLYNYALRKDATAKNKCEPWIRSTYEYQF